MKLHLIRPLAASVIAALALAGCGQPAAQAPTSAPAPTTVAVEPTVAAPPTPVFEPVDEVEPTSAPAPTAVPTPAISGALDWRDAVLRGDGLSISISGLAAPAAGEAYLAWLSDGEGSTLIGPLRIDGDKAALEYASPEQINLVGAYERVYIARQAASDTDQVGPLVLSGALPPEALIHVRHVLSGIGVTPGGIGFAVGLRAQADELLRHAQFLRDALEAGDLALERAHAEHIINIIRGSEARDANGDGEVQNPGDGFGLLPNGAQDGYIKGTADHARLAAEAADATDVIKVHAGHVQIAAENSRERTEQIRALAEQIVGANDLEDTRQSALALLSLAEQLIQGVDADRDEQIAPIPGEGGVLTAYQHAQLMAGIPLAPVDSAAAAPPAGEAAPVAAATAAPADHSGHGAAPVAVEVEVGDNTFGPAEISVPAGGSVTWRHIGQRPHTVTATDGSFNSGTIQSGDSFSQTFDTPGIYQYLCEFHEGMVGSITVTGAAAAAPAPTSPAPAAPAPAPAEAVVSMRDFEFVEREIRVRAGTRVIWRNDGTKQHSATAVDGSFDTGLYGSGEERAQTFDTPGTYLYYCVLHAPADGSSGMVGTVIVEP